MAEKILKGINFPGLEDTYLIPEVDSTLSKSGQAADAKIVGEALAGKQPIGNYIKTINGEAPDENGDIVVEISSGEMEQVQSDWNVNDETDAAYIKNKPFGEVDNGIKYLNNKYLDFMQSLTDYVINPRKQKLELNGDIWLTNDYVGYIYPTEEEWQNLLKIWNESNQLAAGATISINSGDFTGHFNPISYDENNRPTTFQWTNSNASITVTIGKSNFNDKVLLPEVSVDLKVGGNGIAQLEDNPTDIGATENFLFEIDKEYIVTWDGIEYEVTGTYLDYSNKSAVGVGNIDGGGTEPFSLITAVYNGQYYIEISSLIDSSDATHQISIREKMPTYLGIVFIMPEGAYLIKDTKVNIFSEQTVELNDIDSTYGAYTTFIAPPPFTLRENKNYTVVWDGVEYPVTGIDTSNLIPGSVAIGDGRAFGYPGNGEPFIIMNTNSWAGGNQQTFAGITFLSLVDTVPTSHTIEIYEEDSTYINIYLYTSNSENNWQIKKKYLPAGLGGSVSWNDLQDKPFEETANGIKYLDNKYLEFIETSNGGTEIIPEQEISLFVNDNGDGTYSYTGGYINYNGENIGTKDESFYNEMLKLQVGKEYIITYNGKEYKYSAIDVRGEIEESGFTAPIAIGLGNPAGILTEEHPIGVTVVNMVMSAGVQYAKMAALNVLASENSEPIISTFGIREASSSKIKKEYLPDDIGGSVNPDTLKFKSIILESSTEGSSKCFKITIDDTGTLSVEEIGG